MLVVGLDLGTSSIKAVRFRLKPDGQLEVEDTASVAHKLEVPSPGFAEQDAAQTLQSARVVLDKVIQKEVLAIGVSGAMHSLLCLDENGQPLGRGWTWADLRSADEARQLKRDQGEAAARTGTPIHPMAWPAKLLWMREHDAELWDKLRHLVGIPEYVVAGLTGTSPLMGRSQASATGLHGTDGWDARLLEYLQLDPKRLPEVVASDEVVGKYREVPVIAGAGDGPLSNLGTGAHRPGRAALSIGTSGAIRVAHQGFRADPSGRTFCYSVVDDLWVSGGAISNGTLALEWLRNLFGEPPLDDLLQGAWKVPAGSEGLIFLPYLAGERAPHWDPSARGKLVGLQLHHGRSELTRAVIEGVCFALRDVLETLPADLIREVRVTGGFTRSPEWVQILADVFKRELMTVESPEAGALGAAGLAARAVDPTFDLAGWLDHLKPGQHFPPTASGYDAVFQQYQSLYR
jgi:gluconokinase